MEIEPQQQEQGADDVGDLVSQLMQEVVGGGTTTTTPPSPPSSSSSSSSFLDSARLFAQWRLSAQRSLLAKQQAHSAKLQAELEHCQSQLSKQNKDFSHQMHELTLKRNHGLDVTELAQQVRDLVKEIDRLKKNAGSTSSAPPLPVTITTQGNKMVSAMLREYHFKLCRLEEEIGNEQLKRATETARRVEKESECNQCRRQMDDMRAEIVSLQLKLARMEVAAGSNHNENHYLPRRPSNAPKHAKIVAIGGGDEEDDDDKADSTCTQQ